MNTIDVVVKELKDLRKHLDTNFPSKQDLKDELKGYATKDDLKPFATKDDLQHELKKYATKDDLKNELKRFATKDDLKREIHSVIEYMDDFFVRGHKLGRVEKTLVNHEARLMVLEQK